LILRDLLAAHAVAANRAAWAAAIGAGLFALHPLQVESVAWASGLKDVLAGAFTLVALWLFLRFTPTLGETPGGRSARTWDASALASPLFVLATLAFVLAMLSKPSAVAAPALAACLVLILPARPGSSKRSTPAPGAAPAPKPSQATN